MMVKLWRATDDGRPDHWVLFDHCASLRWSSEAAPLDSPANWTPGYLDEWTGYSTSHLHVELSAATTPDGTRKARWFCWLDDTSDNDHLLIADSVVYILTDAGDTVERVR